VNHLAHLVLAEPTPASRLGNLIADYLRPMEMATLPAEVRRGVMQHRSVDGFTDRHPAVHRAIGRLPEVWGWFKGIVVDVYFDHLLARTWAEFGLPPMRTFVDELNADLLRAVADAPPEAAESVRRIVTGDRLMSYERPAGVEAALRRLTGIIRERMPTRALDLVPALADLEAARGPLTADFREFFPDLRRFSDDWLGTDPGPPPRRP